MAMLTIHLLGAPHATLANRPLDLRVRKELALLAYLAVESGRPHRRDHLLGLLWPDLPEEAARNNLRVALARLRRILGDPAEAALVVDRQLVQFLPNSTTLVDVQVYAGLLEAVRTHQHPAVEACEACVASLAAAVEQYHGEFLAGFNLPDSVAFEEWALVQRERLHQQQLAALDTLTSAAERRGDHAAQAVFARRQLALEPWRESAHAQLIRGLWASGHRGAALEQYETCRRILESELGLTPSPELHALAERLRAGDELPLLTAAPPTPPPIAHAPVPPAPNQPDIPETPRLYGRDGDLVLLQRWLVTERCRLVGLLGIGGVGKTSLAAAAARAVADRFDAVAWLSLLNAPPLDELLRAVLGQLTPGTLVELPPDPSGQIAMLLAALRGARCLLVLDNMESLLRADEPGMMRAGYEGYAQLLRTLAERTHQSCVLLTSRERPQGLARLEEDTPLVRLLHLDGLNATAGTELLAARGLREHAGAAGALAQRYSGNPLALRLVAQTVREVFDGDIGAFLAAETTIFDDISAVLDQQLTRLTPLERELLVWLAILREPTPVNALRGYLVRPESARAVVEAARALLRRSLVAQSGGGLALQNVVTEYLTDRLTTQMMAELDHMQFDWLHRYALLTTATPEYVRQSQLRMLVEPVAQQLAARHSDVGVGAFVRGLLDQLRRAGVRWASYAAGNLLNLLVQLQIDLQGYDFSNLSVWQAGLRDITAFDVRFSGADLAHATFADTFDSLSSVAISPDGTLIAAASNNGVVGVWRVADGQRHRMLTGHSLAIWSVAWSLDGTLLASVSSDSTRVWDVATGQALRILHEQRPLRVVSFIPGAILPATSSHATRAALLATCDGNSHVRIWNIADGALIQEFNQRADVRRALVQPENLGALSVNPAGTLLATCDGDGVVQIWRIADGTLLRAFNERPRALRVAFGPDSRLLATGHPHGVVQIWNVETGALVRAMDGQGADVLVWSLAWHPHGEQLAAGGSDSMIRIWDVATGHLIRTLHGHSGSVDGLAWSQDGAFLASACHDQTVRLWHGTSGDQLRVLRGHAAGVVSMAFGSNSTLASTQGNVVHVWDVARRRVQVTLRGHRNMVSRIVWSRDGALLVSVSLDDTVRIWDVATHRPQHVLARRAVESADLDPAGRLLALGDQDGTVEVWDIASGTRIWQAPGHTQTANVVCFSPDGGRLYSGGAEGAVRVWDATRGDAIAVLRAPDGDAVLALASSPDQQLLAWATRNDGMVVAPTDGSPDVRRVSDNDMHAGRLAWSPDGRQLASSGTDRIVRLWQRDSWAMQTLGGHQAWVGAVIWSPDGALLASSSTIGEIMVWDGHSGAPVGELRDDGPYTGMDISGATGISTAQRASLLALGAVDQGVAASDQAGHMFPAQSPADPARAVSQ